MPFIFTFNDLSSTWTPRRSSGKESACQCRRYKRPGFNPCVGKSPWRGKWQPTPVFLLRKSHGQRCLVGYSLWDHKESDMTEHIHYYFILSYNKIMIHILVSLGLTYVTLSMISYTASENYFLYVCLLYFVGILTYSMHNSYSSHRSL